MMDLLHDELDNHPPRNVPAVVSLDRLFESLEKIKDTVSPVVIQYHLDQLSQFMNNEFNKKKLKSLQIRKMNATMIGNTTLAQACNQEMQMLCHQPSNVSLMNATRHPHLQTSVLPTLAEQREYCSREGSVRESIFSNTNLQPMVRLPLLQNSREGSLERTIQLLREPGKSTRDAEAKDKGASNTEAGDKGVSNANAQVRESKCNYQGGITLGRGKAAQRGEERNRNVNSRQTQMEELEMEQESIPKNGNGGRGRGRQRKSAGDSGGKKRGRPAGKSSGTGSRAKSSEKATSRGKVKRRSRSVGTPETGKARKKLTTKDKQPQSSLFLEKLKTKYLPLVSDSPDPLSSSSPKDSPKVKRKRIIEKKENIQPKQKTSAMNRKNGVISDESDLSYLETPKSSKHSGLGKSANRKLVRSRAVMKS